MMVQVSAVKKKPQTVQKLFAEGKIEGLPGRIGTSVTQSAEAAGINRVHAYDQKRNDPDFAKLWEEALDSGADALEDEAQKRALAGSDVLLMFLLKGIRPQKWRESRATVPHAELNKMIEIELARIAKQKEAEALEPVN